MIFWGPKNIMLAAAIAAIVLVSIIFAIPFIDVSYEAIDTYEVIEIKQESYIDTESNTRLELCEREEVIFDDDPFSVPEGIIVDFSIGKPDTKLLGNFTLPEPGAIYVYSSSGKIIYEQLGIQGTVDVTLGAGEYRVILRERVAWEERVYLYLKLKWTEQCEVTETKDVSRYRYVPVKVEKQDTVIMHKKASFWEMIFTDQY